MIKEEFNLSDKEVIKEGWYVFPKKDVKEFLKKLKDFIMYKVDLEDNDKQYHQIMNEIDRLAGEDLI